MNQTIPTKLACILILGSLSACGRADLEDSGGAGGAGAGVSGSSGSAGTGAVGAGAGSGSAGTGAGSGAVGAGASSSAVGTGAGSGSTGAGGGEVCPGWGDRCSECLSTACPEVYCACHDNPECLALIQCSTGCGGDQACVQACLSANGSAISQVYLVSDCAATLCDGSCRNENPVEPCLGCLAQDCDVELNSCLADAECLALFTCLDACDRVDLTCQQGCYDAHGTGVTRLQTLLECSVNQCDGPC